MRRCHGGWAPACGDTTIWSATPRSGSGRPSSQRASTALRKLRCIIYDVPTLVRPIAQAKSKQYARKQYFADKEKGHADADIRHRQGQRITAAKQREQRFRNLVETAGPAAGR